MIFAYIEENRQRFKVNRLCDLLGVSRSGFYAWRTRPVSKHRQYDESLKVAITELHQGFKRAYGAPRVYHALKQQGVRCSVRRVNRLMRELGIKASTTGLYVWRPGLHAFYSSTGNQLAQLDEPAAKGQQWAGDFTYIRTQQGWLYHAVVIDLFSRKVVGAAFSKQRNASLTSKALKNAVLRQKPQPGCLFHSDQGIEYAAHEFRDALDHYGFTRSMSRKGQPKDNAAVESFFHTMKAELIHQQTFNDAIDAVTQITEYIAFYNQERIHSSLSYQSPINYEKLYA